MTTYDWTDLPYQPLEKGERLTEQKFAELVPQLQRVIEDLRDAAYKVLLAYPLGMTGAEILTQLRQAYGMDAELLYDGALRMPTLGRLLVQPIMKQHFCQGTFMRNGQEMQGGWYPVPTDENRSAIVQREAELLDAQRRAQEEKKRREERWRRPPQPTHRTYRSTRAPPRDYQRPPAVQNPARYERYSQPTANTSRNISEVGVPSTPPSPVACVPSRLSNVAATNTASHEVTSDAASNVPSGSARRIRFGETQVQVFETALVEVTEDDAKKLVEETLREVAPRMLLMKELGKRLSAASPAVGDGFFERKGGVLRDFLHIKCTHFAELVQLVDNNYVCWKDSSS